MRLPLKLPFNLPISVLATGASSDLPAMSAGKAASSWAVVLMAITTLCNFFGIDLFAVFSDMGFGSTPEEVIATGERAISAVQQLLPLAFGIWAWIERKAPKYRLTFWGPS